MTNDLGSEVPFALVAAHVTGIQLTRDQNFGGCEVAEKFRKRPALFTSSNNEEHALPHYRGVLRCVPAAPREHRRRRFHCMSLSSSN